MSIRRSMWLSGHPLLTAAAALVAMALLLLAGSEARGQAQRRAGSGASNDTARAVTFNREIFRYDPAGRRDPFVSLVRSTEIRPVISDLRLTTVAFDPLGHNSVAVLRDLGTKEQYRVKVGSVLGRMRVVRIDPKIVTFALEEYGFSRQETLAMGDSTHTRTP